MLSKRLRNAIVNFNKIKEVYQLRPKLERSAKTYVDLAQLQYINGVINYMDVLDAQRGYFDAQIDVSNAIRDELIAVVNVYKALGGGWQSRIISLHYFSLSVCISLAEKSEICDAFKCETLLTPLNKIKEK